MYFRKYGLRKTCLETCLKTLASDDPLKSNMIRVQTLLKSEKQYL